MISKRYYIEIETYLFESGSQDIPLWKVKHQSPNQTMRNKEWVGDSARRKLNDRKEANLNVEVKLTLEERLRN